MGKYQNDADGDECTERCSTLCHEACGNAQSMPERPVDNAKIRMLL
jgi:hypothetical protein